MPHEQRITTGERRQLMRENLARLSGAILTQMEQFDREPLISDRAKRAREQLRQAWSRVCEAQEIYER